MAGCCLFLFCFLFQSGICFRCRLENPRRFPNFHLPTIGVTADYYILHFLDNRRCSYTIHFVQHKHNFCCKWTCLYTYIQGFARSQTSWVLQSTLGIKYLFSFLHPYSKGDLGGGLASLACVHTYTWNATRSMCCLNDASDGGGLTREESFDKANFTLSLFRSLNRLSTTFWVIQISYQQPACYNTCINIRTS